MKRSLVLSSTAMLMAVAALGASASVQHGAVARFSARSVEMTSPARLAFRRVDITVSQWSTDLEQRRLGHTLREQGPAGFVNVLCGYPAIGSIEVAGGRAFTIRYAWQRWDRDGARHVYLGSDEPIVLASGEFRRFVDPEPLYFVELRIDAHGDGVGRLSDARRLSFDESRNVIEMRDYDARPLHLVMVHDESFAE
ncbi:MAG TPA: hypothetical protein VG871_18785 [Vicinamibacterales bacterium]|nr:hypothetical protein [Vicinamibacterales bacterium]